MSVARAQRIATTLLYEGYMLYPYRPSAVKNRTRFNFGVLYPDAFARAQAGSDASSLQTECVIEGTDDTHVDVHVRFLHLMARMIGELPAPLVELPAPGDESVRWVDRLVVDGQPFQSWQEAVEREVIECDLSLGSLCRSRRVRAFASPAIRATEPIRDATGSVVGVIERHQRAIVGDLHVSARQVSHETFVLRARVINRTPTHPDRARLRDDALLSSLVSAHVILNSAGGAFVSAQAPPDRLSDVVASCDNVGLWPVLAGENEARDTVLASPIIIYDHPELAPESPGDLFDSTEIDEILSLRILTLTDDEKREMANADQRARRLLERTESLDAHDFMRLHGAMRRNSSGF